MITLLIIFVAILAIIYTLLCANIIVDNTEDRTYIWYTNVFTGSRNYIKIR